ncbi:rod shape-determining protein MreD [Rhodovulum tesquicola]|uniref:rod shape-determining protein MreD n=1 Tax=Rhodovulum tesquicola TaxID=540254 RepID=UPI002097CB9B|nr:rod shape-determining protein MreD [Rhodovulum tesquicola]MCO8145056.1 rod shape-determining protein MreD [Rhodovulum tesquicola]
MVDPLTLDRWLHRLIFGAVAGVVVFVQILPLETRADILPGPEWMLCLTFAWLQRRPDYLPPWLIACVFLMLDMLLMRPPGLFTALALMGAEFLRARQQVSVETPFGPEWLLTGGTIGGVFLAYALVLALFGVPEVQFGLLAVQAVLTVLAYPLVALAARYLFMVRRVTPGELDPRGLRR